MASLVELYFSGITVSVKYVRCGSLNLSSAISSKCLMQVHPLHSEAAIPLANKIGCSVNKQLVLVLHTFTQKWG